MRKQYVDQIAKAVESILLASPMGPWRPERVSGGRHWVLEGANPLTVVNLWYYSNWVRIGWEQQKPFHYQKAKHIELAWEDAKEFYSRWRDAESPNPARSWISYFFSEDKSMIYITDARQAALLSESIVPKLLPELLTSIEFE